MKEPEIKDIIQREIDKDEKLGSQPGGSGHLSDVSVELDNFNTTETETGFQIDYEYTKVICTEFTIEPDNPPHTYSCSKTIWIDQQGKVIKDSEKSESMTGGFPDIDISFDDEDSEEK